MTAEAYAVPAARHRREIVERRSRFIATVDCTESVADARDFIDEMRSETPDATHHVYAFRVGSGATVTCGMSDDGEPSGTAGRPVLAVVLGSGLGDVCVVVTRYFGGTKLGTGGLVRAYSEAARRVLADVPTTVHESRMTVEVRLDYGHYEAVRRLLPAHRAAALQSEFGVEVRLLVDLPASEWGPFSAAVVEVTAGRAALRPIDPQD